MISLLVLWTMAHHFLTTTLQQTGNKDTVYCVWNQKSNCWALIIREIVPCLAFLRNIMEMAPTFVSYHLYPAGIFIFWGGNNSVHDRNKIISLYIMMCYVFGVCVFVYYYVGVYIIFASGFYNTREHWLICTIHLAAPCIPYCVLYNAGWCYVPLCIRATGIISLGIAGYHPVIIRSVQCGELGAWQAKLWKTKLF